jgi:signal transduction histidine kinase
VKFTEQGKVTFKVVQLDNPSLGDLTNHQARSQTNLRFQINDTGIGMSSEALEKIFQPFEQALVPLGRMLQSMTISQ